MRTNLSIDTQRWPEVWQAAYRILEGELLSEQLRVWIQHLELLSTENLGDRVMIRLGAMNNFTAQWIRDKYRNQLENAFTQVLGYRAEVQVMTKESQSVVTHEYEPPVERPGGGTRAGEQNLHEKVREIPHVQESSGAAPNKIDPRYRFNNFVVGSSNQFAHASAVAVAENPAQQYNPLFLYSPPGLGKTHLLYAIGNHILAKNPDVRVAYLSAEGFVNELIDSLQHKKMPQFRAKYRESYDVLLIDDIQFIAGKKSSEEEFFHTFNALHSNRRQIVVSSDRPPKEIDGLEERIRTRFEWGLISDISPPEIETRIAILKAKAEQDDIYLPDDVSTFLASCIRNNVRELEGVLTRLKLQVSLTGAEISLEMAKQELKMTAPEENTQFAVESIMNAVAKHYQLKIQDLKSISRARTVALPRQIAMYLIRKYTGMGFVEIGQLFGGKDHSTILHGVRKIEKEVETEDSIRQAVEKIQNLL